MEDKDWYFNKSYGRVQALTNEQFNGIRDQLAAQMDQLHGLSDVDVVYGDDSPEEEPPTEMEVLRSEVESLHSKIDLLMEMVNTGLTKEDINIIKDDLQLDD